ncbi:MAG: response regulator, partial [Chitinispirillia bacterium]
LYSLDYLQNCKDEAIKSEEKMKTLLETAPDAIVTSDLDWTITSCNNAALKLLNFQTKKNLIGQSALKLIAPDDEERALSNMKKLKKVNTHHAEYLINCGEKGMIPIKISASILFDKDKKPYGIIYIARDISESRELEEKLRQSEKMQAIGQLAGGIAHDFNNQLAGIVGYADLIREEVPNNSELFQYADNILLSSKKAMDLTAKLLAFARKGRYLRVMVDLHYVITEVVTVLNRTIDKRIKIRQIFEAKSPVTNGDPTQIQNAIMNIALNSSDAMPKGGKLIFATEILTLDDDYCNDNSFEICPGQYIQVSVTDNGEGIPEDTKKRIFEPFFTTKPQGKGTGMGLPSVYGTMINHKGAINVYSESGYGTTINLYFPLETVGEEQVIPPTFEFTPDGKGSHILLIDDEEFVLKVASVILEKSGYKVSKALNGKEALEFYGKSWKDIDLVILDMIMPELNGKDTYVEMKKINPQILALLSSGYSINDQAQEILDKGVQGFIKKPYRKTELLHKISDILETNIKGS